MRKEWFEHVRKTRKKLSKKDNPCSHVEAMKKASVTWADVKVKVLKRKRRLEKQAAKAEAKKRIKITDPDEKVGQKNT